MSKLWKKWATCYKEESSFGNDKQCAGFGGRNELSRELYAAVSANDVNAVRSLLAQHPELLERGLLSTTCLNYASKHCNIEMIDFFLNMGQSINATDKIGCTPLEFALRPGRIDFAKHLLARGADVAIGRPLIGAITCDDIDMVKLLVEHGADVNHLFLWLDDPNRPFSPLSFAIERGASQEVIDFLRSQGAKRTEEIQKGNVAAKPKQRRTRSEEVIAYFEEYFGAVDNKSLIEIVPTDPPISVHVIKSDTKRNNVTLFTTGMSAKPLNVPKGGEDFQFAELFIQLPADWPLTRTLLEDPKYAWPVEWLRKVGKYPQQHNTWLGGPATIIANDDPARPLFPQTKFTSILLLAEHQLTSSDGKLIRLYRMLPLYTEERELEKSQGIAALLNAFDAASIPFVVDLKRPNVGLDL